MENLEGKLIDHLSRHGFRSAVAPIFRVKNLQSKMDELLLDNTLNKDFYERYLSRIDCRIPEHFPETGSIIIVAAQQPKVKVEFTIDGRAYSFIIPPTYSTETDKEVIECLTQFLNRKGYVFSNAIVPEKMLAVHSGLASYGKNNIGYIDGWGSFFRLTTYFSDMPSFSDRWDNFVLMEQCDGCNACIKKCPTQAISADAIRISADRCMTFINENPDDFPDWIDRGWQQCLIGCMVCQDVCPVNRQFSRNADVGCSFSEEETKVILQKGIKDKIPEETANKLEKLGMLEEYEAFSRNLEVLIRIHRQI